jgi:hypothetical protein
MDENQWLNCDDPKQMLELLIARDASERKLRLFAILCCRRVWDVRGDHKGFKHSILQASEGAAEGTVGGPELAKTAGGIGALGAWSASARALDLLRATAHQSSSEAARNASECATNYFALTAMESVGEEATGRRAFSIARRLEQTIQAAHIREIFGNPYRPVAAERAWLMPEVVALACDAYGQAGKLYLLAEVLERAGCKDAEILSHRRQIGPHVRGCWVMDLMLGKS